MSTTLPVGLAGTAGARLTDERVATERLVEGRRLTECEGPEERKTSQEVSEMKSNELVNRGRQAARRVVVMGIK